MSKLKKFFNKLSKINKVNYLVALIILILCISVVAPSLARLKNRVTLSEVEVWDGTVASSYHNGSGTQNDPYVISNGSELAYFSKMLESNDYSNTYFVLSNDIIVNNGIFSYNKENGIEYTLSNSTFYVKEYTSSFYDNINRENTAIGTVNIFNPIDGFKGYLDGDYHTIYGLYITSNKDNVGLFTNLEGTVNNLYVSNSMIYGGNITGGIASNATNSTFNNILFEGNVIGKNGNKTNNITNTIEDKTLTAINETKEETITLNLPTISGNITSKKLSGTLLTEGNGNIEINGIPITDGEFHVDLTSLENIIISYSSLETATFTLTNLTYNIDTNISVSGGIVGIGNNIELNNTINKSYVYGNEISGGLIGQTNGAIINRSYNKGNIESANISGGLIGSINQSENTSINHSYNNGEVIGIVNAGIVGNIDNNKGNISIENTFNTKNGFTLNTINNSNVNINNLLYTDLSINVGNTNGELSLIESDNLQSKNYLTTLGFSEFIDSKDVLINPDNAWIYDDGIPILYIDDVVNSIANIHLSTYTWNNFSEELTPIKFNSQVSFSIEEADTLRPFKEVYYYINNGNTPLNKSELENIEWESYTNIVNIDTEGIYIIYAKVVDYNDNITYLNTDIIIYDTSPSTATITIHNNSWSDLRSDLQEIYIGKPTEFIIEAFDDLSGIATIEYYITDKLLTEEELDNLDNSSWINYENNEKIDVKGKNIIYVKVVDNCDYITYVNTDYINYDGYDELSIKAGDNITADKIYITDKSSVTLNIKYATNLEYKDTYTHNIITNTLLPKGTKITLINKLNNKTYSYQIDTEEDIFNYESSCTSDNCNKYATYPFTLFKEVGKVSDNLFVENYSGNINENFIVIVDFANTNITQNYENVKLYLELREEENVVIPTLEDTIKSFSIYKKETIKPYINTDYTGTILYNNDSSNNINLSVGLLQDSINSTVINDTTYENKNLGIAIKLVDSNNNIVSKNYLKNIKFIIDDNIYTPESDGIVRINLNSGISNINKVLTIETSKNDLKLASGTYYFKIYSYTSYDGIYANNSSQEISIPVDVRSTEINNNYKFDVDMKNIIRNTDKTINIKTSYDGNLVNPNIRISLYKKYELTAYNQDYMMLDLPNYIMNNFELASDKVYYLTKTVNSTDNFTLNIGEFSGGGYLFVFELYDGSTRISTIEKKFIVRY